MSVRPETIDVEAAHEYLTENRAQFVDARPRREFEHAPEVIPGAMHIDPGGGVNIDEALRRLPREKLLIAYCDEPNQAASAQVARRARSLGQGDASVLAGGFAAWKDAGKPTVANLDATRPGPQTDAGQAAASAGVIPPPTARPVGQAPSAVPRRAAAGETAMVLSSSSFADGQPLPRQHAADGGNTSPPLAWTGMPRGTRTLALVMEDLDAFSRGEPFAHWVLYNIQASSAGLPLDAANRSGLPVGCQQGTNDFGQVGYRGPDFEAGWHRYQLRLFALDTTLDPASLGAVNRSQLLASIEGHVLAEATLGCTFERSLQTPASP